MQTESKENPRIEVPVHERAARSLSMPDKVRRELDKKQLKRETK